MNSVPFPSLLITLFVVASIISKKMARERDGKTAEELTGEDLSDDVNRKKSSMHETPCLMFHPEGAPQLNEFYEFCRMLFSIFTKAYS